MEGFSPRAVDLQSIPLYFRHGLTSRAVVTPINPPNRSLTEAGGGGYGEPLTGGGPDAADRDLPRSLQTATASPGQARPSAARRPAGTPGSRPGATGRTEFSPPPLPPHTHRRCPAATSRPSCSLSSGPALRRKKSFAAGPAEGHATASLPDGPRPPQPRHLPRHAAAAASRGCTVRHGAGRPPLVVRGPVQPFVKAVLSRRGGTGLTAGRGRTERPWRATSRAARPQGRAGRGPAAQSTRRPGSARQAARCCPLPGRRGRRRGGGPTCRRGRTPAGAVRPGRGSA